MEEQWFKLSIKAIIFLFAYLVLLLIVGAYIAFTILWNEANSLRFLPVLTNALIGSIGFSLVGSCVFYIRKLYKACINKDVKSPKETDEVLQQVGVFMYFFMRPIYAVIFSFIVVMSYKEMVLLVVVPEARLNDAFIYTSMLMSFFAGFAAGDVVTALTKVAKEKVHKFLN